MGTAGLAATEPELPQPSGASVDFHVHLFGVGDGGTGCSLSPGQRKLWSYRFFQKLLGLSENGRLDQDYVAEMVRQLRESSIERGVLLAQDARYDARGRQDLEATNFYVPNDYLFQVVTQYPDLFVPCVSINPQRGDAIEELDRCAEKGARVLKIHPPTQNVNPADERFRPFYRRVAGHKILLMVHTGSEHSSHVADETLTDPAHLQPALEEGCTVIAAHSGMGSFLDRRPFREDYFQHLAGLIRRFPNLYCETAVLASMFRWRCIPRLLEEPDVLGRLIHASDWPFTSNAVVFWNRLSPGRLLALASEKNFFERDLRLKSALGLPAEVFQRGAKLLQRE